MAKARDAFLKELIGHIRSQITRKDIDVDGPDVIMKWHGQPSQFWPKADAVLTQRVAGGNAEFDPDEGLFGAEPLIWTGEPPGLHFIIELDEDSDPGRSLIKYWPYLDKSRGLRCVYIGVWKKGQTYGDGYFELARFIAQKLEQFYPFSRCFL